MSDEGCVEDALQDLRCVEEALQQAERAVRRHKRRNGQLLAQLVHILGPRNSTHTIALMQEVKLAQTACARHVAHYQRRASLAQATLQIAELWDRLVVPWFTQSVMCEFYNGVVRRRLRQLDTRLQKATRRLSGRYRWKAVQETKQEKDSICEDTQQSTAVDWVLAHYMPFMCHALLTHEKEEAEEETSNSDIVFRRRRRSMAEILYLLLHVVPDAVSTYYLPSLTSVNDTSSATSSLLASDDITLPRDTAKLLHLLAPPTEGPTCKISPSHAHLVMLLRYVQGLQTLQNQLDCITSNTSQCEEETSYALPLWPRACAALRLVKVSEDSTKGKEEEEQIAWGHTMSCTRTVTDEELVALSALSAACCEALCSRMWHTPTTLPNHQHYSALQPYEACSLSSWGMQYRRIVQTFDLHWEQVTSAAAATQLAQLPCRASIAFVYALLKDNTFVTVGKDVLCKACSDEGDNYAEDKDSVAEREWCAWWRHVLHTLRRACGKDSHNNEGEENDEFVRLVGCPAWCCTPCIESTQQGSTSPSQVQPSMECDASALGPTLPLYRHCPLLYCIEHAMASAETQKSDK